MKVIGYVRVSTSTQDVERQKVKIAECCSLRDYQLIDIYSDYAISGATFNRDGFIKLMRVTKDDADMIIISELSRLSRKEEILDTLTSIQGITSKGLKLVFLDSIDKIYEGTLDLIEIITLSITAYGAIQERKSISRRNQEGKDVLFKQNPYGLVDALAPYGYNKVENPAGKPKYILEENPEEAAVVRDVFNMVVDGLSLGKLTKQLFHTGIRTKKGLRFSKQFLVKFIANPLYKGDRIRKGCTLKIKPIVDPEIWETAQVKIKENKDYSSSGISMFNPLKGILKCRCGRAMVVKKKYEGVYVYRCSQVEPYYTGLKCEYYDAITYGFTNSTILAYLKSLDFVEVGGQVSEKIDRTRIEIAGIEELINNEKQTLSDNEKRIINYYDGYAEAENSELRKAIQIKIDKTNDESKGLKRSINKKEKEILVLKGRIRDLEQYSRTEDFENLDMQSQATLYRKYIKKIEFLPVTTMQGFYKIDLNIGVTEYIAVRKTKRSPLVIKVPYSMTLNDDLTLSYTEYEISTSNYINLVSSGTKNISIQEFFKKYSEEDRLLIDLEYRDFINQKRIHKKRVKIEV